MIRKIAYFLFDKIWFGYLILAGIMVVMAITEAFDGQWGDVIFDVIVATMMLVIALMSFDVNKHARGIRR